jgi:ribonucleotide reductase beta subunit family protein with ferritin-like domain
MPIILGYDSSLKEYEQQAATKVASLLLALDDKVSGV